MPKYENSNTGDVVEYEQPSPRLEALPNWTRLDPAAHGASGASATTTPDDLFDPAVHDAAEVVTYLNSLDLDDEDEDAEYGRVMDAERAGKDRKTVLALDEKE